MITRRTLLKTAAAAAATSVISAPAIGQGTKKITFLTWNIIDQKELIRDLDSMKEAGRQAGLSADMPATTSNAARHCPRGMRLQVEAAPPR